MTGDGSPIGSTSNVRFAANCRSKQRPMSGQSAGYTSLSKAVHSSHLRTEPKYYHRDIGGDFGPTANALEVSQYGYRKTPAGKHV